MFREGLIVGLRLGLIAILLVSAGCAVPSTPQKIRSPQLVTEDVALLGQQSYLQIIQQEGGVYPDRELNAYVNHVGLQLISGQFVPEPEYTFQVINDSALTSYSMPGGFVAISRGLLSLLKTEAQLAAVLSHEVGHLTMRHHLQGTNFPADRGLSDDLLNALSPESEYRDLVVNFPLDGTALIEKTFSLEQEKEADRIAIGLLASAGYLPTAMVDVQRLVLERLELDLADAGTKPVAMKHPLSLERLQASRDFIASRYARTDGRTGYIEYSEAVESLSQVEEGYLLFSQGRHDERQGKVGEAIATYHRALQAAPDESLILAGLGLAYLRNEDPIPALRYLTKAVQQQDNYAQTRLGLGYIYLQKKEYAKAIEQFERCLELSPTVEAVFLLADAWQNLGQEIKARDLYLIVSSLAPEEKLGRLAETRLEKLKEK